MGRHLLNKEDLKDKKVHVRFTDDEYDELKGYCERTGVRPSDVIRRAINLVSLKVQCGIYRTPEYLETKKNQKRKGKSVVLDAKVKNGIFRQLWIDSYNARMKKTELVEESVLEIIRKQI